MQVFIKTLTGKTITVEIDTNETILEMKKRIAEKENIPVSEQRIIASGKECDDNQEISVYKFHTMATVHLVQRKLFVSTQPTKNKDQSPKKLIKTPRAKKGNPLQLFVKTLLGKTVTLEVFTDDTILDIKEEIASKENMPIESIRLIFAGKELDDAKKIADYGVQRESTLQLINKLNVNVEIKKKPKEQKKNTKLMWRVGNFNPMEGDDQTLLLECFETLEGAFKAFENRRRKNIKDKQSIAKASIQAIEIDLDELDQKDVRRAPVVYQNVPGLAVYGPKEGSGEFVDFKVLAFYNKESSTFNDIDVEPDNPQTRISLNGQLYTWANAQTEAVSFFLPEPSAPLEDPYEPSAPLIQDDNDNDNLALSVEDLKTNIVPHLGDSRNGNPDQQKCDTLDEKIINRFICNAKASAVNKLQALEDLFLLVALDRENKLYTHRDINKQGKKPTATQKRHIGLLKSAYVAVVEKNSQNPNVRQMASTINNPEGLVDFNRTYGYQPNMFRSSTTSTREQIEAILNPARHLWNFRFIS